MFQIEKQRRSLQYQIDTLKVHLEDAKEKHWQVCLNIAKSFSNDPMVYGKLAKVLQHHGEAILANLQFKIWACGSKSTMLSFLRDNGFIELVETENVPDRDGDISSRWVLKSTTAFWLKLNQQKQIHDVHE